MNVFLSPINREYILQINYQYFLQLDYQFFSSIFWELICDYFHESSTFLQLGTNHRFKVNNHNFLNYR